MVVKCAASLISVSQCGASNGFYRACTLRCRDGVGVDMRRENETILERAHLKTCALQVSPEALEQIELMFTALDADQSGQLEMSDFLVRVGEKREAAKQSVAPLSFICATRPKSIWSVR